MKQTYTLDDAQWNRLVQDVTTHFDDLTLKRGFQYYKQGCVQHLNMPAPLSIESSVEGSAYYRVRINLEKFSESRCSCPVGRPCKHIVASLLEFADEQGRSVFQLANAKTNAQPKSVVKSSLYPLPSTNEKQLALKKEQEEALNEQVSRIPELSITQWHRTFELCTASLNSTTRNAQFIEDTLKAIYQLKPELPSVAEHFFMLHSHLFVLSKLTSQINSQINNHQSYMAYQVHHVAAELQASIENKVAEASPIVIEAPHKLLTQETLTYIRKEMLTESNGYHYFLTHYLNVWIYWISPAQTQPLLYSDELEQLEVAAAELTFSLSHFSLIVAQIGMHLFQNNDLEAWKLLKVMKAKYELRSDYVLYFLSYLSQSANWDRLISWLIETAPLFSTFRNTSLPIYSDYWELAIGHQPEAEKLMWDTLVSMLPHSRSHYEQKLITMGAWKRWMDYHLSKGSDALDFRVTELAPLEKNAPDVLLPFYHQAVERYILNKNRDSYKAAVKLLKRLAKLYKKMKQETRWENYIAAFAFRNSRLRALQEELRKGKLLE